LTKLIKLISQHAILLKWKGINRKQSTRWQHLSRLKASVFFSLQIFFSCYETQQLILGTGTAIWWVTGPHPGLFSLLNYFHFEQKKVYVIKCSKICMNSFSLSLSFNWVIDQLQLLINSLLFDKLWSVWA
jgi:hypothetical protein